MHVIGFAVSMFLIGTAFSAHATSQITDVIKLEGESAELYSEPLSSLLNVPEDQRTIELDVGDADCSASWRGYRATWSIEDDRLFLDKVVTDPCGESTDVPIESIFHGKSAPLPATWFSGVLVVPRGEMTNYVHMGYESEYERYLLLVVKRGEIVFRTEMDERPR